MEPIPIVQFAKIHPKAVFAVGVLVAVAGFLGWYFGSHIGVLQVNKENDSGMIFSVASSTGNTFFVVANDGNVGVNTLTPKTNLDVVGLIRSTYAFVPKCTKEIEGAFAYETTSHHFVGCNGVEWRILDN
jgi:hypothetical protein